MGLPELLLLLGSALSVWVLGQIRLAWVVAAPSACIAKLERGSASVPKIQPEHLDD